MVMFLPLHPINFMFFKSSDLLEHLAMLLTSTLAITNLLKNSKATGIINFAKHFLNFTVDTTIKYLNSILDLDLYCARGYQNQNFMAT